MPRMLDDGLLNDLEQRWRDHSPTLLPRLQHGISDAEIDRVAKPLGYAIPEEVRRWYRWHNGSSNQAVILYRTFGTLADDVTRTVELEQDDEAWPKGWMRVMDERPFIVFDCRDADDDHVPVWHFDYSFDHDHPTRPVFASIGDMVTFWIELIDAGHLYWDADNWHIRDTVPEAISERICGVPTD